ncbi:MAG: hypothetical protein ACPGVU_14880 [Limisphaerales bacterium]
MVAIPPFSAHGAARFANGFYETTNDSNARQIVDVAGEKWRVGPRLVATNRFVEIVSRDNWNDHFQLSVCLPKKGGGSIPKLRKAARIVFPHNGEGWDVLLNVDDEWFALEFLNCDIEGAVGTWATVNGRKRAKRIAKCFALNPYLRRHPGHRIAVKFEPVTNSVPLGIPIKVRMTLRNVGTNPVHFHRGVHRDTECRYSFMVSRDGETLGETPRLGFGGIEVTKRLEPAAEFTEEVELDDWFRFHRPGSYSVKCLYDLLLLDPANPDRVIWTDLLGGELTFEIVGP